MEKYIASEERYSGMEYRRCGRSGISLPAISFGLWHNFGGVDEYDNSRRILLEAFDHGVTHFDLANNYGPPPGSAEETFGRILRQDLHPYRDELIISTKAGYYMWPGPYGEWGSRKYLLASLDQSLKRMGIDYVDIFYHHRPDPNTPLDETLGALDYAVRSGKALYVGISNYSNDDTLRAVDILRKLGTPCLIHQSVYNMFKRRIEKDLLTSVLKLGVGCIAFSPLAQGLLTDRYINGIPKGSRASKPHGFLRPRQITPEVIEKVKQLNILASRRGQSLAQMALAWILRQEALTSVLVGASSVEQLKVNLGALNNLEFTEEELSDIEKVLE
ncbi:MAG: L-glyceraldehyde 3-phosphate reductase [Bacteroidales bacterium]|nr:L-glyceraldehyde 3-phosphate reductase [Lentimicrobiaceae bacterium]MDD5693906.1 L-glyceraldehyde 3-phosphate reductase [Bacteroidales bacterium]